MKSSPLFYGPFRVVFLKHREGVFVSCPNFPGCHSHGATVEEAQENHVATMNRWLDCIDIYPDDIRRSQRDRKRCNRTDAQDAQMHAHAVKVLRRKGLQNLDHLCVVKALQKVGYENNFFLEDNEPENNLILILMNDENGRVVVVPRASPVENYMMAAIVRAAGLTLEGFKKLL